VIHYAGIPNDDCILGKFFVTSLLWNTQPEKMWMITEIMITQSEKYGIPFDYEAAGIIVV